MTSKHFILWVALFAGAIVAPPAAGEESAMPALGTAQVGDVPIDLTNGGAWAVSVRVDTLAAVIDLRAGLWNDATQLLPGEGRRIVIRPGTYQVMADGVQVGAPVQLFLGHAYGLTFGNQSSESAYLMGARILEGQATLLDASLALKPTFAGSPGYVQSEVFVCPHHPEIRSVFPRDCPICCTRLEPRWVLVPTGPYFVR